MRILMTLVILALFASSATAQQTMVISGVGARTCAGIQSSIMASPQTASIAIVDWVDGYLTGHNMQLALEQQKLRKLEQEIDQMTHIFDLCARHPPDFLFIEAIDNYFNALPVAALPVAPTATGVGAQSCAVALSRIRADPKNASTAAWQNRRAFTDWVDGYLSGRNMQLALNGERELRKLEKEPDQMRSISELCTNRPSDFKFTQAIDNYFTTLPVATLPAAPTSK